MGNSLKLSIYKIGFIIFVIFAIIACNKTREGNGIVLDYDTKQPIEGVNVDLYYLPSHPDTLSPKVYTDSNGKYHAKHEFGNWMMQFTKKGYISYSSKLRKNDTIYLEVYNSEDFE